MEYIRDIPLYAYRWPRSAHMNPLKNVYNIGKAMEYQRFLHKSTLDKEWHG
jgi:hypothetical protein